MIDDDLYHKILSNVPIACVDVLLEDRGKVLLLKRTEEPMAGRWWFPGGRVAKGEAFGQAAARKMREECGIAIRTEGFLGYWEETFPIGRYGEPVHSIMLCFKASRISVSKITLNSEHSEYKWVDSIPGDAHDYINMCMSKAGYKGA